MFPVPDHLPRPPLEHASESASTPGPDAVLDLVESLFAGNSSHLSKDAVGKVRHKLQAAVEGNKVGPLHKTRSARAKAQKRGHDLVQANFPSISSHIRLGQELHTDFARVQNTLIGLEDAMDPSNEETSFLPPVLALLDRHFQATQAKSRALTHVRALKCLKTYTDQIERVESAVWAGRSADQSVLGELASEEGASEGEELLEGTQSLAAAKVSKPPSGAMSSQAEPQDRLRLLRSMIVEQITDAFGKAVSFAEKPTAVTISVQAKTTIQPPRGESADVILSSALTDSSAPTTTPCRSSRAIRAPAILS